MSKRLAFSYSHGENVNIRHNTLVNLAFVLESRPACRIVRSIEPAEPRGIRSLNHDKVLPNSPIAVNIESKREGEALDKAGYQLVVCPHTMGHLNFLAMLLSVFDTSYPTQYLVSYTRITLVRLNV